MKHPNKIVEKIRKEYAQALIVLKRNHNASCFDWWLAQPVTFKQSKPLTEKDLIEAVKTL